ncbi:MAG: efflux RND transporter periplasmic adaptor subunit [Bacillota bacterium]|jgi:RND family efflux transporter MFP subunit|nr:efflux RND transporter periplasmic adaptor subunit [Pseudacidobacterium ailaaui]MDI3253372.1 efflux RND transporter periplasmic adaptor subunit [Bacillota bacterium]
MKAVLFSSLALLSGLGCHGPSPASSSASSVVRAHEVQSRAVEAPQWVRVTGTIHARDTAVISAQISARILNVLVREGDTVHAGQLLLVLDDQTLRAGTAQAQAALAAARDQQQAAQSEADLAVGTLARYKLLQQEKSVSPQEFDEVEKHAQAAQQRLSALKAQVQAAQAVLQAARNEQDHAHLRAPFAGVITLRLADPGTLALPGAPLLQLDKAGPLQLDIHVDESLIAAVHPGQSVPVEVPGAGANKITATVDRTVPAADPSTRSFVVKLNLPPSPGLKAGMFASAWIANGTHTVITIPETALVTRGSLSYVYVVDAQGTAQLRYVTTGNTSDGSVSVLSGLNSGETLVDAPGDQDLSGKKIEVLP